MSERYCWKCDGVGWYWGREVYDQDQRYTCDACEPEHERRALEDALAVPIENVAVLGEE